MQAKSQRKIIQETSQRFNTLVQAGAKNEIAYNFYLASLRLDLKAANRQQNQKVWNMKTKTFFDRDAIAIKSEDKKRRRQNVKKARMVRTVNKRGGWLSEY